MSVYKDITNLVLNTYLGVRAGAAAIRTLEYDKLIDTTIKAKDAELDVDAAKMPMLSDRLELEIEGSVAAKTKKGIEAGIDYYVRLAGGYSQEVEQAGRVKLNTVFESPNKVRMDNIKGLSVEELKSLRQFDAVDFISRAEIDGIIEGIIGEKPE